MIILNMGIPRSGTTWAFNVLRYILEAKDVPYATRNANSRAEVDAALAATKPAENLILHFHDITDAAFEAARRPGVASFFCFRDPRDVVVSQMRLHDADFPAAVRAIQAAFKCFKSALGIPGIMVIPYPHIRDHAEALIFQMATTIGRFLTPQTVGDIAQRTSIERHKEVMETLNRPAVGRAEGDAETIFTGVREILMDSTHFINDRHIQSGATGRWKEELTQDQQDEVNRTFAEVIARLGFDAAAPGRSPSAE